MTVCFTVDVEQDCPPYLDTWRGIERGLPALLDLLDREGVHATCFTTGQAARRHPDAVRDMVARGHELGCHGDTHRLFSTMTAAAADREIGHASASLRAFGPVVSFRAPNLRFPAAYLRLLERHGYAIDSSQGRHKRIAASVHRAGGLLRIPASVTSSTLRWPAFVRDVLLGRLREPVVLFVHPWEFVDLSREPLRFDCRFRTGEPALDAVRAIIRLVRNRGARFHRMRDCAV
jgi:peptidoglycan/xylan/chitin deacetylase (PgdA/CDA1 family)